MTKFHLLIGLVLLFQINTLLANSHKSLHDKSIQYQQNFIGLSQNYFSQSGPSIFFSFHDHDPAFGNSNFHTHTFFDPFTDAKETIITTSIEAQYYLIDQIAFGFKLPIHKHQRIYKDEIIKVTGLGDLMLNTLYHFYNSKNFNPNEKVNHLLTGFFQVQIPTGIYRQADILNDIEPHIQNGTGSFNYDIMLAYKMDYNKWRFNLSSIYHLNQKNYYQFKVGNSIVSQLLATYNLSFNSVDVAISTGLDYRKNKLMF